MSSQGLASAERERWERDGFLVRESVLTLPEIDRLGGACEELCDRRAARSDDARKFDVSSFYMFEHDELQNVMVNHRSRLRIDPLDQVLGDCATAFDATSGRLVDAGDAIERDRLGS